MGFMRLIKHYGAYFPFYALSLFTTGIHAAPPITLLWQAVINDYGLIGRTHPFRTNIFTQQDGQPVYTYTLLPANLQRIGIIAAGTPASVEGDNLIDVLAEALQTHSAGETRERIVNFEAFPAHWLNGLAGINRMALDRVHSFQNHSVYVNLQPLSDSADVAGVHVHNTERHPGNEPSEEAGADRNNEGVTNPAFENGRGEGEANQASTLAVQTSHETPTLPIIGVILQKCKKEEIQEGSIWGIHSSYYRLIVIPQALDDNTVNAILNNWATGYFHTSFRLRSLKTLRIPSSHPSEQNQQVNALSPEESPQVTEDNCTTMLIRLLLFCCCHCMASTYTLTSSRP